MATRFCENAIPIESDCPGGCLKGLCERFLRLGIPPFCYEFLGLLEQIIRAHGLTSRVSHLQEDLLLRLLKQSFFMFPHPGREMHMQMFCERFHIIKRGE